MRKHQSNDEESEDANKQLLSSEMSMNDMIIILIESCESLFAENLYNSDILDQIKHFRAAVYLLTNPALLLEINSMLREKFFNNKMKFYVEFYGSVVSQPSNYLSLDYKSGQVLCRKFGEYLFSYFKRKNCVEIHKIKTKNLSQREFCAMQYLAGYVLHKLFLKHRNLKEYKSKNNQEAMAILQSCKSNAVVNNAKLIEALNRGGLWTPNTNTEKIFSVCEKYFCIKTDAYKRKIELFKLVKAVMEFQPVVNAYQAIVENCEITVSKENAKVVLYNMVTLYLRVRTFSLAKDFVQKEKLEKKEKGKINSLRKELKKSSDKLEDKI